MRLAIGVVAAPGIIAQSVRIISKTIGSGRPSPSGIFPFRLRGQAILRATLFGIQPADKLLHVLPGDTLHWQGWVTLKFAGIVPHDGLPLALGHLVLPQVKRLADAHRVDGMRVVILV